MYMYIYIYIYIYSLLVEPGKRTRLGPGSSVRPSSPNKGKGQHPRTNLRNRICASSDVQAGRAVQAPDE